MILEILAGIAQVIWIISILPQILKTLKTKDVKGLSVRTWICFLIGYSITLPILYKNGIWVMIVGYFMSMYLILFEIFLIIKYR